MGQIVPQRLADAPGDGLAGTGAAGRCL